MTGTEPSKAAFLLAAGLITAASLWAPAAASMTVADCLRDVADDPLAGNEAETEAATPESVAGELYGRPEFLEARTTISPRSIARIGDYLAEDLVEELCRFSAETFEPEALPEGHKLPYPEGPVFHSNYEGVTAFSIGTSEVGERRATVEIDLEFEGIEGEARWTDLALFVRERDRWRLSNIQFDPERYAGYTLRDRIKGAAPLE